MNESARSSGALHARLACLLAAAAGLAIILVVMKSAVAVPL